VPSITTVTKLHTIEIDVDNVLLKIAALNHLSLDGRQQVTRKNLPVIVVVLDHVMPVSCWYIMQMAINTIPIHAI
jgi:hypothetical protein